MQLFILLINEKILREQNIKKVVISSIYEVIIYR